MLAGSLFGALLAYTNDGGNKMFVVLLFIGIGWLIGSIRFLSFEIFAVNRRARIYEQAKEKYDGKLNEFGYLEVFIKGRKVWLDYGVAPLTIFYEYIAAYVEITNLEKKMIPPGKSNFRTETIDNKPFVRINAYWGSQGYKFNERINKKIDELNDLIKDNSTKK